jgi:hypothetical protein
MIFTRISPVAKQLIKERADETGQTVSALVRVLVYREIGLLK